MLASHRGSGTAYILARGRRKKVSSFVWHGSPKMDTFFLRPSAWVPGYWFSLMMTVHNYVVDLKLAK